MTGQLLHQRVLRPDGSEVSRGPLVPDVIADAVKAEGVPWHILEKRGWRLEPAGAAP